MNKNNFYAATFPSCPAGNSIAVSKFFNFLEISVNLSTFEELADALINVISMTYFFTYLVIIDLLIYIYFLISTFRFIQKQRKSGIFTNKSNIISM